MSPGKRKFLGARVLRRLARGAGLLLLALVPGAGCGREFFREWANQDVSEAVFEKSRDPRWRLDTFSIEPPAMARFADWSDPDVPPAPPDDYAAKALSPMPQNPDHWLMVPMEGTGYLDMMEAWQRAQERPGGQPADVPAIAPFIGAGPSPTPTAPLVEPSNAPSPFAPAVPNSGPNPPQTAPNTLPGLSPPPVLPPETPPTSGPRASREARPGKIASPSTALASQPNSKTQAQKTDAGLRKAAYQATQPTQTLPPGPPPSVLERGQPPRMETPPVGMDPGGNLNQDLSQPINPRPDLSPEQYRESEAKGAEMAGLLVPEAYTFDEAEAAGLPKGSRPYVITIEQVFTLALINSRFYQFQLEQVYLASLAVTLQRFAFEPQFIAGMSPLTQPVGAAFPVNPINQFLYRTKEAGAQTSTLSLGTVAGFGKLFVSGGRLLMGFANQVVFNFTGKTPRQPSVQSSLPLTFVQPFLRNGGRAVTLEPLTQAERTLLYAIRSFAKFRQEFVVTILVGGQIQNFGSALPSLGFSGGGNIDPIIGFLPVLQDIQQLENDRKNIAAFEQLAKVYAELIHGEASGLTQLQLDQINSNLLRARGTYAGDRVTLRSDLDQFKIQLGLPPDTPLILDRTLTRKFKEVFDTIDLWSRDPRRDLSDLPRFANSLPHVEDVIIDGRSVLGIYENIERSPDEDKLEDLLLAGERMAFEHRLDLMNVRAGLFDSWRQIRVTANALLGVLNVTVTNQLLTPPATTNPFAFVDQAKQFSLVINAELPLIRVLERNNFRQALINYQRARRTVQNTEDFIKYQIRNDIRQVQNTYLQYELARRNFVLTIRQKDQAFEQIIAPPAAAGGANPNGAIQTTNLINFQGQLLGVENQLVQLWVNFQTQRLTLYRDLGTLPYDEWEAFGELFPSNTTSSRGASAASIPAPSGAPAANPPQAARP